MGEPAIGTRKWTRLEYDQLVEAEVLGPGDRIELLGGQMIVKEPQYSPHATAIQLVQRALDRAFGPGWSVRLQLLENIGIIVMGIGLAVVGRATHAPLLVVLGLGAAVLHVWNHAIFKALLFLSAGGDRERSADSTGRVAGVSIVYS